MKSQAVEFGREVCCNLDSAQERDWLVTNGIGGFASGTIAGLLTRRYHGLLFAALKPPLGRTLVVTKLDATAKGLRHRRIRLPGARGGDGRARFAVLRSRRPAAPRAG